MKETETNHLPVILYGAGNYSKSRFAELVAMMPNVVCFCDSDESKQGRPHCGLPVLSWSDATAKYKDFLVYVSAPPHSRTEIMLYLLSLGVSKGRILNLDASVDRYKSCQYLEWQIVCFQNGVSFCCEVCGQNAIPSIPYEATAAQTYERLAFVRKAIIDGNRAPGYVTTCCIDCIRMTDGLWPAKPRIAYFNLGTVLSPCNFNCIYCNFNSTPFALSDNARKAREYSLQLVAYCAEQGLFDDETEILFSGGEISIDPQREEILSAISLYRTSIASNCSVYVERIGEMLRSKRSCVIVSVDAGTRETFKKIRGVDMFDKVRTNVARYIENGQVNVKYIILPGLNDDDENINGFVDFTKYVGANMVFISGDNRGYRKEDYTRLLDSILRFSRALAKENIGITILGDFFPPNEYQQIQNTLKKDRLFRQKNCMDAKKF